MSHFTVMVIGDNWEEQLAPYQENNMGDCPEEYLEFNDIEEEYTEEYENKQADAVRLSNKKLVSIYSEEARKEFKDGVVPEDQKLRVSFQELYETFDKFVTNYHGYKKDSKTGRYGYWENPNAKWDWYAVGGRWTGFFALKSGVEGATGAPGLFTEPAKPGYADQCRKQDIDIARMKNEAGDTAAASFDKMEPAFKGQELPSWKAIREKHGEDIGAARIEFRSHPVVLAMEKVDTWATFDKGELADHYCNGDRDKFIERAREGALRTFAVVKDGNWYEKGSMGWWGHVSDEKETEQWNEEFSKLINDLPDDTLITMVDCHI